MKRLSQALHEFNNKGGAGVYSVGSLADLDLSEFATPVKMLAPEAAEGDEWWSTPWTRFIVVLANRPERVHKHGAWVQHVHRPGNLVCF